MKKIIKKRKKIFTTMLSAILILSVLSVTNTSVLANDYAPLDTNEKVVIDHVVYSREELGGDKLSDYYIVDKFFDSVDYAKQAKEIKILSVVNDLPVKKINAFASKCENKNIKNTVTKVNLPESITEIGAYAFTGFKKLKKLTLPKKLEKINERAFNLAVKLETITIPKGVKTIEEGVFFGCSSLKKVIFKGEITQIYDNAFNKCKKLKSIVIPNSTKLIGESAFSNSALSKVEMPSGIHLTSYVFSNCKKLKTVVLNGNKKPNFVDSNFANTKKGIKFYVKNKKVAKSLKKQLKNSGAKNPKIYIGKKLYK